jgi:hypothetical protein
MKPKDAFILNTQKTRIKINTYGNYIDVYYTNSLWLVINELMPGYLTEEEASTYDAGSFARPRPRKKGVTEFFMIFQIDSISANSISHEAMHCTSEIMEYHGVKHDPNNDEPFCYLIGFIVGKIHERATKLGFKIKNK